MSPKKASTPPSAWIKDDEIRVQTDKAPWMEYAKAELAKGIKELAANDGLVNAMRAALAQRATELALERSIADFGKQSLLLGRKPGPFDPERYRLVERDPVDAAQHALGRMEADTLQERNPEINKYMETVQTDPIYDRKGRSWPLAPTYESGGQARVTAWCAAFVNWCLAQAGAPRLGFGTARSWLEFGTPIAHPVFGCIVVIRPSSSTGSTTGHVAFFVEKNGARVKLLGGNQGDSVNETFFAEASVLGYRWPTTVNQYLFGHQGGVIV